MQSKTPQFDALLDPILEGLVPHKRDCADCAKQFELFAGDVELLKMLRVPPPTLCPDCRNRRRLSFANYANIYKRKCDVPGHSEMMISLVAPVMPWVTYDHETYYSDSWDPLSFGINIKVEEPFFGQFLNLLKIVPQPGVRRGAESPNSDFSFYGKYMKDCYYVFGGRRSEDILYSSSIYDSQHIVDCYLLRSVDTAYETIGSNDCYHTFYTYFSHNCINCEFIHNCRNCQDCFGCVNLRNKQFCWENVQLSKEEYKKRRAEVDLSDRNVQREHAQKFWALVKESPIEAVRVFQSENSSGNDLKHCKNCFGSFQLDESENVRYASFVNINVKDSMDMSLGGKTELLYETQNVGSNSSNVKFSYAVKESSNLEFSISCSNCHDCFGCIGLKNKSFCIFNKQYEPEEYFKLIDAWKTAMLAKGEYGEFFPMSFAPYPYNSSMAHIMFPLSEEEVKARGLFWHTDVGVDTSAIKTISASELPQKSTDATSELYSVAIIGERSGKPFRLTEREVTFYQRFKLPLPTDTPYQRILDRYKIMNDFKIHDDVCFKCGKKISSAYKTSDGWKPYCGSCYQQDFL